jgi:hypothetical protein
MGLPIGGKPEDTKNGAIAAVKAGTDAAAVIGKQAARPAETAAIFPLSVSMY